MTIATITTKDELGRVIEFKPVLSALEYLDFIESAGTMSDNQQWVSRTLPAFMVKAIDGVPTPTPTNRAQLRQQVERVATEGLAAVLAALPAPTSEVEGNSDTETAKFPQ